MTPAELELKSKPELLRAYHRNVTVNTAVQMWVYGKAGKTESYERAMVHLAEQVENLTNELCRAVRMGYTLALLPAEMAEGFEGIRPTAPTSARE